MGLEGEERGRRNCGWDVIYGRKKEERTPPKNGLSKLHTFSDVPHDDSDNSINAHIVSSPVPLYIHFTKEARIIRNAF